MLETQVLSGKELLKVPTGLSEYLLIQKTFEVLFVSHVQLSFRPTSLVYGEAKRVIFLTVYVLYMFYCNILTSEPILMNKVSIDSCYKFCQKFDIVGLYLYIFRSLIC